MIVLPLVCVAHWVSNNDVVVNCVQHLLEICDLEGTLCCSCITASEANVHLSTSPQVALPRVSVCSIAMIRYPLGTHTIDVKVVDLGKSLS